ncbi:MAG: alkaline phosphatase D family protein [Verrucomicrobia bacterium]|nr:alkaline phosphatase D family protein [Verrucomicrobiota bacterium]
MRTNIPGGVSVTYGTHRHILDQQSAPVQTNLANDNTAVVTLTGLEPDTEYFYRADNGRGGSFRTFPDPDHYRNNDYNPEGLFNFQFQFTSCANQSVSGGPGPDLATYDILNETWKDKVLFGIMNGDLIYEEDRAYPVESWRGQVHISPEDIPKAVQVAPSIVGVWENYKTYLSRGINLAKWHQEVPNFFTFDDHEILNDIYGPGEIGYVARRAVFRDQGVKAWWDYVGWANPMEHKSRTHFGRGNFKKGSDVLYDPESDFTKLKMEDYGTLHVHWGKKTDGVVNMELDLMPGDPNSGVYGIVEVIDEHRLRIEPAAKATNQASYSIGRRSYGSFKVSNCEYIILQTRSHRSLHDVSQRDKPGATILGKQQFNWLKDTIDKSTADFIFLISTVDFMIPHVGSGGGTDKNTVPKDDAWTVFLEEREELIEFCDAKNEQQFFVLTGDLHNSFAIKITDNMWEFASGPANSVNHVPRDDEGNRPANGKFKFGPREVDIHWSTYVLPDIPRMERFYPTFCIAQINNVFNNPVQRGGERWVAYPKPHIIFKYYDGYTGELLYAQPVHAR